MATLYRSTDTNAPAITGQSGSLITVLRACLVDGYSGKTAAGWTVAYEDVANDVLVLRNNPAGGTGMYLRIDDSDGRDALVRLYSSMSDVDTGDDPTPTVAQFTNGNTWCKSSSADSTEQDWFVVADDYTLWINIWRPGSSAFRNNNFYGAGDFESFVPGDGYAFFLAGGSESTNDGNSAVLVEGPENFDTPTNGNLDGLYLPRAWDQTQGAIRFAVPNLSQGGDSTEGALGGRGAPMSDPEPSTGLRQFMPAFLATEGALRGQLRGVYVPLNDLAGSMLAGEEINAPQNMPAGSNLVIARAAFGQIPTFDRVGTMAIETGVDW